MIPIIRISYILYDEKIFNSYRFKKLVLLHVLYPREECLYNEIQPLGKLSINVMTDLDTHAVVDSNNVATSNFNSSWWNVKVIK